MFDIFVDRFRALMGLIPFTSTTWLVIGMLAFVVAIIGKSHKSRNSSLNWEHLVIDSTTDRASPYKLGYLVGVIVSTWLVMTLTDKGTLTFDILGLYLTYLLGGAGWNQMTEGKNRRKSKIEIETTETTSPPPKD